MSDREPPRRRVPGPARPVRPGGGRRPGPGARPVVLRNNYAQNTAIANALAQSKDMLHAQQRFM
ncbi:hypothetical protein AB0B06_33425, partial [Streptomyces sp. NPDC044989]|uniref:hypothetical protein n=1 Tax=Streptomyces sp. NPDC044989 TaxID=3154336 RepID=UPI0033C5CCBB